MKDSVVHGICFHGIGNALSVALEPGEHRYWIGVDEFHRILDVVGGGPTFGSASTTATRRTSSSVCRVARADSSGRSS